MRKLLLVWIFVSFFILSTGIVDAIMGKISLQQLVSQADLIIIGQVESVEYQKKEIESVPGQKKEVEFFTLGVASVKADNVLKGHVVSQPVLIEFSGGNSEDSPNYKHDEEVVVFLKKIKGKDSYFTIGMFQGKYSIKEGKIERESVSVDEFIKKISDILQK